MSNIVERFADAVARTEEVIFLGGALDLDNAPEALDEFFEDQVDQLVEIFGANASELTGVPEVWEFQQWLIDSDKLGYLVKFATPVMDRSRFSWGCYRTRWVYGDTFEAALDAGFAWVESMRDRERNAVGKTAP